MEAVEFVNRFYTPPLCLFGAIGNSLSVYVFCMTSGHRNLSSSYYLSALAISDIGFLINLFAVWLTGEGYEVITTKLSCPFVMYLGQVTCFLSVWFVVAFTCERFCAVCYPLTRPTVCTVARAKKVILILTVGALTIFSYVWVIANVITVEVEENSGTNIGVLDYEGMINNYTLHGNGHDGDYYTNSVKDFTQQNNGSDDGVIGNISYRIQFVCSVPEKYHEFSMLANHLDSFFTLILPFCVITFLNLRITLCVWKLKGQRETIVAGRNLGRSNSERIVFSGIQTTNGTHSHTFNQQNSPLQNTSTIKSSQTSSSVSSSEVRVTKTLLLVSTVFLVLNLPSHAIRAFAFIQSGLLGSANDNEGTTHYYVNLIQQWANILFNTNFSVNFLLYCVSGRNFRSSLRNLCWNDRNGRGNKKRKMTKPFTRKSGGTTGASTGIRRNTNVLPKRSLLPSQSPTSRDANREISFYQTSHTEVETYA